MAAVREFKLPDVGEGLTEAEIISWKVKPGDEVAVNDVIVEIETAKSLVELPSPYAGVVARLLVNEGQTVDVGTAIISVDTDPSSDGQAASVPPVPTGTGAEDMVPEIGRPAEGEPVEPGLIGGPAPGGRTSVLVGYGPRESSGRRRARKPAVPDGAAAATAQESVQVAMDTAPAPVEPPASRDLPEALPEVSESTRSAGSAGSSSSAGSSGSTGSTAATEPTAGSAGDRVLAKPPVRRLARDLGIDLRTVQASGPGGVILRTDVEAAAAAPAQPAEIQVSRAAAPVRAGERETRIPIKGVRKMTAAAMVGSAFTAPHVTEFLTVDVSRTVKLVERLKSRREFADLRISPLLILARAMIIAARRTPEINSSWDESAQEIVLKHYVNLGIAAATPRGLVVPNIKDADAMSLRELAEALSQLISTARSGKTQPAEMQQGTITITNVGVFGVDTGTPILNPGESAILAFGVIRQQPWVVDGKIRPRAVTTLGLSFDHRVVDGAQGSQFLADVGAILEDPALALAFG